MRTSQHSFLICEILRTRGKFGDVRSFTGANLVQFDLYDMPAVILPCLLWLDSLPAHLTSWVAILDRVPVELNVVQADGE